MAVKTIVVGIGTEGYLVCERIAKKLEFEFGSLDRVPWIRFLVLETENQSTRKLGRLGIASHIGLSDAQWQSVNQNPSNYDPSIDLRTWAHDLSRFGGQAPKHGANNNRSLGRLCFLHPDNFVQFTSNLDTLVQQLNNLSPKEAKERSGRDVVFRQKDAPGGRIVQEVLVCTVGTTTGGTGSGAMADLGYVLQQFPSLKDSSVLVGFVTIPSAAHANVVHWANAFGALTELNHYHYPRAEYRARYADQSRFPREVVLRGSRPFDYTVVMQPRTANTDQIELVRETIAEAIAMEAVSAESGQMLADLTNILGQYRDYPDRSGRPMGYFSMGVSKLEYPVEHIIEGCVAKLTTDALEPLTRTHDVSPGDLLDLQAKLGISAEAVQTAYADTPEGRRFLDGWFERARSAAHAAEKGDFTQIRDFTVKVRGLRATGTLLQEQTYAGEHLTALHAAGRSLAEGIVASVGRKLVGYVASPAHGPRWVADALRELESYAADRLEEIASPKSDIGQYADFDVLMKKLPDLGNRIGVRKPHFPVAGTLLGALVGIAAGWFAANLVGAVVGGLAGAIIGGAIDAFLASRREPPAAPREAFVHEAHRAIRVALMIQSEVPEKAMLEALLPKLRKWRGRLEDPTNGACRWVEALHKDTALIHKERNERGPLINGHAVFKENETLNEVLQETFDTGAKRKEAERRVLALVEPELASVFEETSRFDRAFIGTDEDFRAILKGLEGHFQHLRSVDVAEQLAKYSTNWKDILVGVIDKSRAFIAVDDAENPLGPPPRGHKLRNPMYAIGADPDAPPMSIRGLMNKEIRLHPFAMTRADSPTSITFIQSHGVFALYPVEGVANARTHFGNGRLTRFDVAWHPLDGTAVDPQQMYHYGLVLTALGLGFVLDAKATDALILRMPETVFDAARDLRLDRDLSKASYRLSQDAIVSRYLDDKVQKSVEEDPTGSLAQLDTELRQFNNRGLTDDGEPMARKDFFEHVSRYVDRHPGLVDRWFGMHPDTRRPSVEDYKVRRGPLRDGTADPLDGSYLCPRCHRHLAWPNDDARIQIPKYCPGCNWQLRFDGK